MASPAPWVNSASAAPKRVEMADIGDHIGGFNLSSLDPSGPAFTPLLYRQREETFPNRTTQVRHGTYLRNLGIGESPKVAQVTDESTSNRVDNFMRKHGLTGLILVQDDAVRLEEYRHGNTPASRNDIQSVTKSFLSTALGIAHAEGKLSVKDTVSCYVEELEGTAWANVPLLALVNMSSGVVERSDTPQPDFAAELYPLTDPGAVLNWLKTFEKVAEPWQKFHYYNPNYYVLTTSLARAIKEPVEGYIARNIWEPAGMRYDAYMRTTGAKQVDGHGGFSVALTDMARFGSFILDGLKGNGGPAVPEGWFQGISRADDSIGERLTAASDEAPPGFGYQTGWWTPQRGGSPYQLGDDGTFTAFGIYGQSIYIIPRLNAVVATQSGYPFHSPDLFVGNAAFVTELAKALREENTCR